MNEALLHELRFDENGLLPAIVTDDRTGDVLMLAYMNREAARKTAETKDAYFYSRSRQELWRKGAVSGNTLRVVSMAADCDQDTVLLRVIPAGPACHTGERSCFYQDIFGGQPNNRNVVYEVAEEIKNRRNQPVEGSYTSYLFNEGIDKVLKKVGEEATEVVIGAKNADKTELTNELADLLYHSLVLMEMTGVTAGDVQAVLRERRPKKEVLRDE